MYNGYKIAVNIDNRIIIIIKCSVVNSIPSLAIDSVVTVVDDVAAMVTVLVAAAVVIGAIVTVVAIVIILLVAMILVVTFDEEAVKTNQ